MQSRGFGRRVALSGIIQLLVSPGLYHPVFAADPAVSKPEADVIERFVADVRAKSCPGLNLKARPSEIIKLAVKDDGSSEFLVRPKDNCNCSPTGNCVLWVLAPRDHALRILLRAVRVQDVNLLQSLSHGRPDLELSGHDSATDSTHWTYQFDGRRYQRTKCTRWSYRDAVNPDKVLSEPRVTSC